SHGPRRREQRYCGGKTFLCRRESVAAFTGDGGGAIGDDLLLTGIAGRAWRHRRGHRSRATLRRTLSLPARGARNDRKTMEMFFRARSAFRTEDDASRALGVPAFAGLRRTQREVRPGRLTDLLAQCRGRRHPRAD